MSCRLTACVCLDGACVGMGYKMFFFEGTGMGDVRDVTNSLG